MDATYIDLIVLSLSELPHGRKITVTKGLKPFSTHFTGFVMFRKAYTKT